MSMYVRVRVRGRPVPVSESVLVYPPIRVCGDNPGVYISIFVRVCVSVCACVYVDILINECACVYV